MQEIGQPIIGEIFPTDRGRAQQGRHVDLADGPRFHFDHPMVGFAEDETQPPASQPADTQALSITLRLNGVTQQGGNTHPPLLVYQQWHIGHSLSANLHFCHYGRSSCQSRSLDRKRANKQLMMIRSQSTVNGKSWGLTDNDGDAVITEDPPLNRVQLKMAVQAENAIVTGRVWLGPVVETFHLTGGDA